jgi:hypothetical protein
MYQKKVTLLADIVTSRDAVRHSRAQKWLSGECQIHHDNAPASAYSNF